MKILRVSDKSFIPASHENPLAPGMWKKVLFQRDELQPDIFEPVQTHSQAGFGRVAIPNRLTGK